MQPNKYAIMGVGCAYLFSNWVFSAGPQNWIHPCNPDSNLALSSVAASGMTGTIGQGLVSIADTGSVDFKILDQNIFYQSRPVFFQKG